MNFFEEFLTWPCFFPLNWKFSLLNKEGTDVTQAPPGHSVGANGLKSLLCFEQLGS